MPFTIQQHSTTTGLRLDATQPRRCPKCGGRVTTEDDPFDGSEFVCVSGHRLLPPNFTPLAWVTAMGSSQSHPRREVKP